MASLKIHSKLQLHVLDGLVLHDFILQENLDKLKQMKPRDDDIWIVTYPKAGTTWTQYIVHLIHNGGKADGKKLIDAVLWIESGNHETEVTADDLTSPRAFKSHMPYDRMPCGPPSTTPSKYIYVARNPKDVTNSYFHHCLAYNSPDLEWKEFFEHFLAGNVGFGDYFDHVLSWWAHKDDDNILFIKFEDIKRDPVTMITRIATFMGYTDLSREVILGIAEKTDFNTMQSNNRVNYSWAERDPRAPPFIRKGIIGDWKTQFSAEDSQKLDKIYQDRLRGTGLEFYFGET